VLAQVSALEWALEEEEWEVMSARATGLAVVQVDQVLVDLVQVDLVRADLVQADP